MENINVTYAISTLIGTGLILLILIGVVKSRRESTLWRTNMVLLGILAVISVIESIWVIAYFILCM